MRCLLDALLQPYLSKSKGGYVSTDAQYRKDRLDRLTGDWLTCSKSWNRWNDRQAES